MMDLSNAPLQRTAEWFSARTGRLTASNMAAAMQFLKNGKEGAERIALKKQILAERLTGEVVPHFVNDAMMWGSYQESFAIAAYEEATAQQTMECGFIEHPFIENFGGTPDRLVGHDGLVETKCPTTTTHVTWVLAGTVPEQHHPQMLAQLACTGRRYVDFVSFDPRVKNPVHRLFIRRFEPTPAEIAAIEQTAIGFLAEIDAMWTQLCATEMA